MTEKRFTLDDGLIWDNGKEMDDVVGVLNALHEENEELKSKYSEQCIQLDFLKDENKHMRDLVNENEQLKQQLDSEHQMLENAILLERTRMGKNCLKQYQEAIK